MIGLRSTLAIVIALVLCMSFVVPTEDVLEVVYDESDSQPYESTSVVSVAVAACISPLPYSTFAPWGNGGEMHRADGFNYRTDGTSPISDSPTVVNLPLRC